MSIDEHDSAEKLNQLLAKLRELDPDTWRKLEEMSGRVDVEYEDYCIFGIIQEAIKAKFGGRFTLNGASIQMKFYEAFIEYDDVDCIGYYEGNGGTPAEALLAAYVQALEAEASK